MHKFPGICFLLISSISFAQSGNKKNQPRLVTVGNGWAQNSVNTVVFRHNSICSYNNTQYIAYYDSAQNLVIGKRAINSTKWTVQVTPYKGKATDAHNTISIMADGNGYLHVSWDHHNNPLRYARSVAPGSLQLTALLPMTGNKENNVTYPEFYKAPDGNLFFLYRDGSSGNGNLMLNYYNIKTQQWTQLQDGWINGEGERNAYWQMVIDEAGTLHLSWVWRESGDVASNHDLCYARSHDGGKTWEKSNGERYQLPVTAATAEYACHIPQKSELINSTSMVADGKGHPYIVTYWRPANTTVPQYHLVYHNGHEWITRQVSDRHTPFSLSGGGTKRIPISRPQILIRNTGTRSKAILIYRDAERNEKVTAALCSDLKTNQWKTVDLTTTGVGLWEPSYDTGLWTRKGVLHLFVQKVEQGDGETTKSIPPQPVQVLEWTPVW